MGSWRIDQIPVGRISTGIEQNKLQLRTIEFMRQQLPAWRDDPDRPDEQAENKLSLQLCKFLDSQARNEFPMVRFDHEEYQSKRRSVDLSASVTAPQVIGAKLHTIYDPILVIECKRLPAPSLEREKEYVTGGCEKKSGGIQRFKLGLHGADLNLAAIIGYIQERSLDDWHSAVNQWISDLASGIRKDLCAWYDTELLEPLDGDQSSIIASFQSVHGRNGSAAADHITIHHLWITMEDRLARS
ncbi:MAG: hypothetical protein ACYC0V_21750 [Armatimonadota bacterium]